jgi:hypothetical protein
MGRIVTDHPPDHRPIFILRIEGRPGAEGIRSLRWLLKTLLRRHGFRCVEVSETSSNENDYDSGKRKL